MNKLNINAVCLWAFLACLTELLFSNYLVGLTIGLGISFFANYIK